MKKKKKKKANSFLMASHYHKPHDDATTYIALLKACVPKKELEKCKRIHAEITRNGLLEKNACVGSTLVNVYAKCGALSKARDVFDQICVKDVVSWTALISGYAKQGQGNEALHCFDMMVHDGISPNSVTFLSILKACGSIGSLEKGEEMHGHIIKEGLLGKDILLGSAVVDMYTKCGAMSKAQEVFDQLPIQDVVCWNALISGYAQHGPGEKALNCFDRMQRQGVTPDVITFVCILKACCNIRAFERGKEIHAEILKEGLLEKHVLVGNALVNMYTKCGELAKAQEVFDGLPNLNIVSWNALIAGYAQQGYGDEVLNHYINMRNQGFCPNAVTFVCILKACGGLGKLEKGKEIHAEVIEHDCLGKNMFIATGLVDMYAKCGEISKAQEVFDEFTIQEVVSCNALIAGCIQYGHDENALQCFIRMQHEALFPDAYTFACILKCCGSIGSIDKGKEIHAKIIKEEILMKSALIGTALVDMYAKCGVLTEAQKVFDQLQIHDIVSWTSLITGYTQHECIEEALDCYEEMQHDGISPDPIIFVCILKACSSIGAIEKGKQIHGEIVRQGFVDRGNLVGNALVDMYAKCGMLTKAQETFDGLPCLDVFTWNAIISGYSEHGHCEKALNCFLQMQNEGLLADASIFCSILKACTTFGAIQKGKEIHAQVLKEGKLLENDSLIGNGLMDMYIKCCSLSKAQEVLDSLVSRDIVPWNTMIAGYVQHGDGEEALTCFEKMPKDDLVPNPFTFVCILKACGSIGALDKGREIHVEIVRRRFLDMSLSTALVEMYARCASLVKAQQVFDELPIRDMVSWTILLAGFAHTGNDVIVIHQLENMLRDGIEPDEVTFTVIFNVCSHSGQPDKAQMYFETMITYYNIIPTLEHYTCMVDLFSRGRYFDKAIVLITSMPIHDYIPIWTVLLGACQQCGNLELGNYAFEHAIQMDEKYATAYVCMSNIYATMTIQED